MEMYLIITRYLLKLMVGNQVMSTLQMKIVGIIFYQEMKYSLLKLGQNRLYQQLLRFALNGSPIF